MSKLSITGNVPRTAIPAGESWTSQQFELILMAYNVHGKTSVQLKVYHTNEKLRLPKRDQSSIKKR